MKIGLALSGGGLRGAAHIGVLDELLKNGIVPNIIAGTSAGSIVASLYALGYKPKEMIKFFNYIPSKKEELNRAYLVPNNTSISIKKKSIIPKGIISINFLDNIFSSFMGQKKFDQINMPLSVITTDLYSGEIVVYTSGFAILNLSETGKYAIETNHIISKAVSASCAIPGIFTPQKIGERTLVDGGLVDNIPADIVKAMGADIVLAVDLKFGVERKEPINNIIGVIMQTFDIMGQCISNYITNDYADLTIYPQTPSTSLYNFSKIPELINSGRLETQKMMPKLKKICKI